MKRFMKNHGECVRLKIDKTCLKMKRHKTPEKELEEMNREFQEFCGIFENLFDMVLMVDWQGNILFGNKAARSFYGFPPGEYGTIFDIRYGNSVEQIMNQLDQAFSSGIAFEALHKNKDGYICPVKIKSLGADKRIGDFTISFIQDMSNLYELEQKAGIFENSLDMTQSPIVIFDRDFKVKVWNQAAEHSFGYSREEIIGKPVEELIPDNRKEEVRVVRTLLRMGELIQGFQTSRIHKNGTIIDIVASYAPLRNGEQQIHGFVGTYKIMSDLEKQGARFQESSNFLLETANFCIWEFDFETRNMASFCGLELMLGYPQGTITSGKSWFGYVHEEDLAKTREAYDTRIREDGFFNIDYRLRDVRGNYRWVNTKSKVIDWKEPKNPRRIIGFHEDVTEKKRIEEELLHKNTELMNMTKEAKSASHAKSMFIANMSHEIRTPLNGVVSIIQLLKGTQLNQEQMQLLALLENSSETLKGIVTNILDISKAEETKVNIIKKTFDLKKIIQNMLSDLQLRANKKGVMASCFVDPQITGLYLGDDQKIKQILSNIISNAIKFTEEGYISFEIRLKDQTESVAMIDFIIKDTGAGIAKEFMPHLFEAFSQENESCDKKYGGTGLGLAISKGFAKAMGGDITCFSEVGVGSTFVFTCPLEKEPEESTGTEAEGDIHESGWGSCNWVDKPVILSVDDNIVNQNVMEYIVTKMGYLFVAAYDATEAMKILEEQEVSLILMDIQLPGMNGYALTKKIRENIQYAQIPIVAMTAYAQMEDREKCLSFGMNDYIPKPIDVDEINLLIKRMVKRNS